MLYTNRKISQFSRGCLKKREQNLKIALMAIGEDVKTQIRFKGACFFSKHCCILNASNVLYSSIYPEEPRDRPYEALATLSMWKKVPIPASTYNRTGKDEALAERFYTRYESSRYCRLFCHPMPMRRFFMQKHRVPPESGGLDECSSFSLV